MTIIFFITTVIFGFGWFKWRVSTLSIVYYLEIKGYDQPNDEDIKRCTMYVLKKLLMRKS